MNTLLFVITGDTVADVPCVDEPVRIVGADGVVLASGSLLFFVGSTDSALCPKCKGYIGESDESSIAEARYCHWCGTAIAHNGGEWVEDTDYSEVDA